MCSVSVVEDDQRLNTLAHEIIKYFKQAQIKINIDQTMNRGNYEIRTLRKTDLYRRPEAPWKCEGV